MASSDYFALERAKSPASAIEIKCHLMTKDIFEKMVVEHTITGVTSCHKTPYTLYFAADGSCDMWKEGKIYQGQWWYGENDAAIHATWPTYVSKNPTSQFYPGSPLFGTPTTMFYYFDPSATCGNFAFVTALTPPEFHPISIVEGKQFPPTQQ